MQTWHDVGIVVEAHTQGQTKIACPKCTQTRQKHPHDKSLSIDFDRGLWHCHHCEWKGTLHNGMIHPMPPRHPHSLRAPNGIQYHAGEFSAEARQWMHARKITDDVIHAWHIGWDMARIDKQSVPAFHFPFFREGRCVNVKYRTMEKRFAQILGGECCLYGLDHLTDDMARLTMVEGELDVLACATVGVENVVSLPNGAQITDTLFASMEALLNRVQEVVLAGDMDEKGQTCMAELARRIGPEKCVQVRWPDGCKDANDTLCTYGNDRVWEALADAVPWPVQGIIEGHALREGIAALYKNGVPRGESTGWSALDPYYRVRLGELTVVTGIPGSGKTVWLSALLVSLAQRAQWRMAIFTPEQLPLERYGAMAIEQYLDKPFGPTEEGDPGMSEAEVMRGMAWFEQYFSFIMPEDEAPTIAYILELAKIQVYRFGIRILVIDPWNETEHTRPAGMTETEFISQSLTAIRRFARLHEVHVFIIAHPTKLQKEKNNEYPIPTAYDISGSANWRNKADNILALWRSFTDHTGIVRIAIQKVRFREIGRVGGVELQFHRSTGRYTMPMQMSQRQERKEPWHA